MPIRRIPFYRDRNSRPTISLSIFRQSRDCTLDSVLLDTGSFATIFPWVLSEDLGISPDKLNAFGRPFQFWWRGNAWPIGYAQVGLELGRNADYRFKWNAKVGFTTAPIRTSLFGQLNSLELFDTSILASEQTLEFQPTARFNGILAFPATPRGIVFLQGD